MTATEEVDCQALTSFIDHMIASGIHGIIPLGSTGEFYALSPSERADVVGTTIEAVAGRVPVLVGANASSTRDVIAFSKQAQDKGADGVLLAAPPYALPTEDELYDHFATVEKAIDIPIMLYNYPGRTGVDLTPDLIVRLAELDGIQYVKESTGDATRVSEIIRRCGNKIDVFCGSDAIALESFMMGAVGWVGGVANVLPEAHVKLYELAVVEKDIPRARELCYTMLPTLANFESGQYTQKAKAGCGLTGHPVGPPRRPLLPLNAEELGELKGILQ
jgi:4-hydroxy-tetrahydrodipicolinate synthase